MGDANVAALQSAINRFAEVGATSAITVDGAWGPQTQQATYNVLAWIAHQNCNSDICVGDDDATTATGLVAGWDGTPGAASGMATFIGRVAGVLGLKPAAVATSSGGATIPGTKITLPTLPKTLPGNGAAASAYNSFMALPGWQQAGIGILAGVGIMFAVKHVQKSKRGSHGRRA